MKLTDAGLETVLLFDEGIELPEFAAFPLVDSDDGRAALRRYYTSFLELARARDVPLVLSAPTWRASPDWGRLLGYEGETIWRRRIVARSGSSRTSVTTFSGRLRLTTSRSKGVSDRAVTRTGRRC